MVYIYKVVRVGGGLLFVNVWLTIFDKSLSRKCKPLLVKAFTTSGELSPSCPRAYTLKTYSTVGIRPEKVISVWSGKEKENDMKILDWSFLN